MSLSATTSAVRTLAPAAGVTPPPADPPSGALLSDALVERGLISRESMDAALRDSRTGRSLNEILLDRGECTEDELARAIAGHYRFDHIDLDAFEIDIDAATQVRGTSARRHEALPLAFLPGGTLVVAVHDPNGSLAVGEYAKATGHEIQLAVASRSQIIGSIETIFKGREDSDTHAHHHGEHGSPAAPLTPAPASRTAAGDTASAEPSPELIKLVREADARAVDAEERAAKADTRAAVAQERAAAAEARCADLEQRMSAAEHHAVAADGRVHEAVQRAEAAEERARAAEDRIRETESQAQIAEERARVAEERFREVEQRAQSADQAVKAAEERARSAETRAREVEARGSALEARADEADTRVRAAEERALEAEARTREADDRVRAAEDRAREADDRIREAEDRARAAEEQARAAEERARAAEAATGDGDLAERLRDAEVRAEMMGAAAAAANSTLERLVRASEILERTAEQRTVELEEKCAALEAERARRAELEFNLHEAGSRIMRLAPDALMQAAALEAAGHHQPGYRPAGAHHTPPPATPTPVPVQDPGLLTRIARIEMKADAAPEAAGGPEHGANGSRAEALRPDAHRSIS